MESPILGELLGKGTFGKVYRIKDKKQAIKYVTSDKITGLSELGELANLKRFDHPYILKCEGFTINRYKLGIILSLASGDIKDTIDKCKDRITHVVLTEWFYQIISAVYFLHKNGFYHCDIKPQNILFIHDKVVLADLGLLGKKDMPMNGWCQSYPSPQLLYSRSDVKQVLNVPDLAVFKLPSNEYQDDVWALGQTFYLMMPDLRHYLKVNINSYSNFIADRRNVLIKSNVPSMYIPLLMVLLEADPAKRSISLISLLDLDLFSNKKHLIDGNIVEVHNPRQVVFGDKSAFKHVLDTLLTAFKKIAVIDGDLVIQACDLLYRTYEFIAPLSTSEALKNYVNTILLVVLKINKRTVQHPLIPATPAMLKNEIDFVKWTNGHLSRKLISDFIKPDKYKIFINWLRANPEKYEQYDISQLTTLINGL
jgi:serine/threonine protein kinase